MIKNNFIKKIFLLILVALFMSTNFFALAIEDSSVNFKSSSPNYNFNAEAGAATVGQSVSSSYIVDHGAYWEEYSNPGAETFGGGGGGGRTDKEETAYTKQNPEIVFKDQTNISTTTKMITRFIRDDCRDELACNKVAIVREIELINRYFENQPEIFLNSNKTSEISRNLVYLLISLLLILIIMILYITYKKMNDRLKEISIESRNKYD